MRSSHHIAGSEAFGPRPAIGHGAIRLPARPSQLSRALRTLAEAIVLIACVALVIIAAVIGTA